jgi:tRNA U34 5-methylaminomethyl-2-thiouridine-forming methyltransferase MnmC
MPELKIVETADGSKTIWNEEVGEHYHSKHGALQESKHVFLQSGLVHYLEKTPVNEVSILEVGFGTALNFLVSADYCAENNIRLSYTGIEAYPLNDAIISQTGYESYVSPDIWEAFLSAYPLSIKLPSALNDACILEVAHTFLKDFKSEKTFDVIYFDAFAAIHQPEMWDEEALESCSKYLKPGGIFVTYAITGNLKRSMKALGFSIEKAKGAPGKREMLRATKI